MTKAKAAGLGLAEEAAILDRLKQMESDSAYNTESRYNADSVKYPGNLITFSEIHMNHLKKFPLINPDQYLSNLRLMTRSRS